MNPLDGIEDITILEFSPAADEIWGLTADKVAGYYRRDDEKGILSFLDIPGHDTKVRPHVRTVYAGGKATNVGRILNTLISAQDGTWPFAVAPHLKVNLTTMLPGAPPDGPGTFSPGGEYIAALQRAEMHGVDLAFVPLPYCNAPNRDRRCIHLCDEATGADLLNFSPHLKWRAEDLACARHHLDTHPPRGLVVLAGSAPLGAVSLYSSVIQSRKRAHNSFVSADIDTASLLRCLSTSDTNPDAVSMNVHEHASIADWHGYGGLVHLHDRHGGALNRCGHNDLPARIDIATLSAHFGPATGPTIGAGDAAHAGWLFGLLAGSFSPREALMLGQATAAAVVRSESGTRRLDPKRIRRYFDVLRNAG